MTIIDILKEKFLNKEIVVISEDGKKINGVLTNVYSSGDRYHDIIEFYFNNDVNKWCILSPDDEIEIINENNI